MIDVDPCLSLGYHHHEDNITMLFCICQSPTMHRRLIAKTMIIISSEDAEISESSVMVSTGTVTILR